MAVEGCVFCDPKGVEPFLRQSMDGSDIRRFIPLINRAGVARYEDKLSDICGRHRSCQLQLSYWNDPDWRRVSLIAPAPATRISGVHRTCFALRTSSGFDSDDTWHHVDDLFALWVFLGAAGSITR